MRKAKCHVVHTQRLNWTVLPDSRCELGESPFWHPDEQMLYWVDIAGRCLCRANVYMGGVERWPMPSEPGCIAPVRGGGLIIALRHGVMRARGWGSALELLATLDYDTTRMRANDGKCDAQGRFWIGTLDESRQHRDAALFCVDGRGGRVSVQRMTNPAELPASTANSLAWSPDGRTLIWSDTSAHTVWRWPHPDALQPLPTPQMLHHYLAKPAGWQWDTPGYGGRPDGTSVDVNGNFWIAMYEGARLSQLDAEGAEISDWAAPVARPTMPCHGGPDLCTLYLTSARKGCSDAELAAYPDSGCVFSTGVPTPGLPVHSCVLD